MAARQTLGELVWKITGDDSGIKRALGDTDKNVKKTGLSFKKMAAVAASALASIGIVKFFKDAANAASDAEETANKFGAVFENAGAKAEIAAKKLSKSFGLSRTESKKLLADTGDLAAALQFEDEASLALSERLNQLALDQASFVDARGADVSAAYTKALLGERESLKSYGVTVSEAQVKQVLLSKGQQQLTGDALAQAKAYATLDVIQRQTTKSQNDYARSSGSYAQIQRQLGSQFKDLLEDVGGELLPGLKSLGEAFLETGEDSSLFVDALKIVGKVISGAAIVVAQIVNNIKLLSLEFQKLNNQTKSLDGVSLKTQAKLAANAFDANKTLREAIADDDKEAIKELGTLLGNSIRVANREKKLKKEINDINLKAEKATQRLSNLLSGIEEKQKKFKSNINKSTDALGDFNKATETAEQKWNKLTDIQKFQKLQGAIQNLGSGLIGLANSLNALGQAGFQNQLDQLDAQEQRALESAGVAEETAIIRAESELESLRAKGETEAALEKEKEVKRLKIQEDFAKKRAKIEYEAQLQGWEYQRGIALAQIPLATMNAIASGAQAPWFLQPGFMIGMGALAGAAASVNFAAINKGKPKKPKFAEGGIVPGNMTSGDQVNASLNSGEMVLNQEQQASLLDAASGGNNNTKGNQILVHSHIYLGTEKIHEEITEATKTGQILIDKRSVRDL